MRSLENFSKNATRDYLQSVVFVDDHIFDHKIGIAALPPAELPPRKPILAGGSASGTSRSSQVETEVDAPQQPYHPKDLVSSFAREGITCALYEPPEDFPTAPESEIFKLCERPDIIILDWDFSGDDGAKALDLIAGLVKQSAREFPHHTRLISIYTADQSLVAVANKIADRLKAEDLSVSPEGAQCRLTSGATRLLVLGKPIGRFGEEDEQFTVKESRLAKKLIEEFAGMNCGILPSYALHGLAAIRKNSKRILDRFHGELDGAFLLHRALVSASEEAFDQLPELLAEEIRAVVEDERLSASMAKSITAAALKSNHISDKDRELVLRSHRGEKPKSIADGLKQGGPVLTGHLRLAALFSSRTQYSSVARKLGFGTVVRYRAKNSKNRATPWKYAVCLVPACDSLRLKPDQTAQFAFWTIDLETYNGSMPRSGMAFPTDGEAHIALSASGKAGDKLWTDSFTVDRRSRTVVAVRSKKRYRYQGCKRTIEWLGQLKPLHAHRIAHGITDHLSRVGVTEAEWLRLLCTRSH